MLAIAPLVETETVAPFDATRADSYTDEDLDRQRFGIICLDPAGTILRYNLAEARFARLDRNTVLGKKFFGQVAPCTARPEFQGRFEQFVQGTAPTVRFEYLFDFKFGAQRVEIEIARGEPGRYYLFVNRRQFLPVREKPFRPAPTQAELAPDEARSGIARDAQQQRSVALSPPMFAALRATWDKVAPKGWPLFCGEWGFKWGRLAVVDLETEVLEEAGKTLRELPMREVLERVGRYLSRAGWGQLRADFSPARQGAFILHLERNAFAESVGYSDLPRCHIFGGFFRAIFSHLADKLLVVREAGCAAQGHPRCSFVVASLARRAALEAAIEKGDGSAEAVVKLLAEGMPRA